MSTTAPDSSAARCRSASFAGRGFSLIEILLAIALFAVGITAILGLLPVTLRQIADAEETQIAAGLPDAVRIELQRLATQRGLDNFAGGVRVMDSSFDTGLLLVASRAGTTVRLWEAGAPELRDAYFLIEARRYPAGAGQLAHVSGAACLALQVRVSWPYRALTGTELAPATASDARQQLFFPIVLHR